MIASEASTSFEILVWIKYIFLLFVVFAMIFEPLQVAIKNHSAISFPIELGKNFVLCAKNLNDWSLSIIDNNGYHYTNFKDMFAFIMNMFSSLSMFILWIIILYKFFSIFNNTAAAKNIFLAIVLFISLQSIVLLINAGINKTITSYYSGNTSAIYYLSIPITCIINFVHAIYLLLSGVTVKTI